MDSKIDVSGSSQLSETVLQALSKLIELYARNGTGKYITWSSSEFFSDSNYKQILQNLNFFKEILEKSRQCVDDLTVVQNLLFSGVINYKTDRHYFESFVSTFLPLIQEKILQYEFANLAVDLFTPKFFSDSSDKRLQFMDVLLKELPTEHKLKQCYTKVIEDCKQLINKNVELSQQWKESEKKYGQDLIKSEQIISRQEKEIGSLKKEVERLKNLLQQQNELIKTQQIFGNLAKVFEGGKNIMSYHAPIKDDNSNTHHDPLNNTNHGSSSDAPVPPERPELPPFKPQKIFVIKKSGENKILPLTEPVIENNHLDFLSELKLKQREVKRQVSNNSGCDIVFTESRMDKNKIAQLEKKSNAIYVVSPDAVIYHNTEKEIYKVITQDQKKLMLLMLKLGPKTTVRRLMLEELQFIVELTCHNHIGEQGDVIKIKPSQHQRENTIFDSTHQLIKNKLKIQRIQLEDSDTEDDNDNRLAYN